MDELIYNLRRLSEWTAKELWENPVNFPEGVLKQAADELEKRRWIPVEERVPEGSTRNLVLRVDKVTNTPFHDILWYENGEWWNRFYAGDYAVTHWMELPEFPEEGKP